MPLGEIETHPYIDLGHIHGANKLILGSFPVYECTSDDTITKQQKRTSEGTIRFFYGSNRNSLWELYQEYIDPNIIEPWNSDKILRSITEQRIALSDLVLSCERCGYKKDKKTGLITRQPYSSEDTALKKREWNIPEVSALLNNGVNKVLCTSKGVLADLESKIITNNRKPLGKCIYRSITGHLYR